MTKRSLLVVSIVLLGTLLPSMKVLAADSNSPEKVRNARMCKRLDEAREGKPALTEVRLEVVWASPAGSRSLMLFGDGVGIWNGERQFRIDPKDVRRFLKWIDKAGFCVWPEKAAQIGRENEKEIDVDALQADREITLTIGDVAKSVIHVARSPEAAPFNALVTRLLDACENDGQRGIGAESLQDGLAKVRDGALAPQVLQVTLNSPQLTASDPEGWLLRLRGVAVETERNTKMDGYTDHKSFRLSQQELHDLAVLLLAVNPAGLPGNIVAAGYTDLRVAVLNRTTAIQARAFAGASATAKPDAQQAFSKLRDVLYDLYRRASREGKASNG